MLADTLISPRADRDIRKRNAQYKKRTEPPNFKDILRKRCRERVKDRRKEMFNKLRFLENEVSVRNALSEFIENDLKELQATCTMTGSPDEAEIMDATYNEPLSQLAESDTEKWILEQYERLIEGMEAQVEMCEAVVCPLCLKGVLSDNPVVGVVTCSICPLVLPLVVPVFQLERLIEHALDSHLQTCYEQPMFTVCPDNTTSSLLLMCGYCGLAQQVI